MSARFASPRAGGWPILQASSDDYKRLQQEKQAGYLSHPQSRPFHREGTHMYRTSSLLTTALIAGCAGTQPASTIPAQLNPDAKEAMTLIVPAKGVQIYECR